MEDIKVIEVKEYDKFGAAYERELDIKNKIVDYIVQSKKEKNKLIGVKFI